MTMHIVLINGFFIHPLPGPLFSLILLLVIRLVRNNYSLLTAYLFHSVPISNNPKASVSLETAERKTQSYWPRAIEADLKPPNIGLSSAWKKATSLENWRSVVDTTALMRRRRNTNKLKPGFHSNAIACVGNSRNKRKRQPIGMLGRSSGNHDWLLANASACVAFLAVFDYATHATQAIAFEWKPGFRLRSSGSL